MRIKYSILACLAGLIFTAWIPATVAADCSDIQINCFLPKPEPRKGTYAGTVMVGQCWNWKNLKCKMCDMKAPATTCNRTYPSFCHGICKGCWPGHGCWDTNGDRVVTD